MVDRYCGGTFYPPTHHGTNIYIYIYHRIYISSTGCIYPARDIYIQSGIYLARELYILHGIYHAQSQNIVTCYLACACDHVT